MSSAPTIPGWCEEGISMEYDGGILTAESEEGLLEIKAELDAQKRRNAEREKRFPGTGRQKMATLCRMFPTLAEQASGIDPWNLDKFLVWAVETGICSGGVHAIRFVLQVWNSRTDWIDLLTKELRREQPADPNDRALWDGLRKLKRRAREHLEEEAADEKRERGRAAPVTEAAVEERLIGWFSTVGPFNVADAFSTWDANHRRAFSAWAEYPFFP